MKEEDIKKALELIVDSIEVLSDITRMTTERLDIIEGVLYNGK